MNSFVYILIFFVTGSRKMNDNESLETDIVTRMLIHALEKPGCKKIQIFVETVINALFLSDEKKICMEESFHKAQKVYHGMCRLARYYKVKSARKYDVHSDLQANVLTELSPTIVFEVFDDNNRTIYPFRISDLISIINTSLTHSPDFFPQPQKVRNPYTNIHFTKAQMYSIYFAIKKSNYIMPILFQQYFKVEFHMLHFLKANECYIRDEAIKSFVRNASINEKYREILHMFNDYRNVLEGIKIHHEFPRKTLVTHFGKYIHDYLQQCYSMNPSIRNVCREKIEYQLYFFRTNNPTYGRKIQKKIDNKNTVYVFIDQINTRPSRNGRRRYRTT